jgi:Txe/YoeB family toxin of Txe-Axe toxin-antitoxin module
MKIFLGLLLGMIIFCIVGIVYVLVNYKKTWNQEELSFDCQYENNSVYKQDNVLLEKLSNQPFTGILCTQDPMLEANQAGYWSKVPYENGIRQGIAHTYDHDGRLQFEMPYENGLR